MRSALVAAILLTPLAARAASFDCKQAHTPREKTICADKDLSAADSKLAASYAALRTQLSPAAAALVQQDQRDWLRYLDRACPPNGKGDRSNITACLADEYSTRQDDLKFTRLAGLALYIRASYTLSPQDPKEDEPSESNPGYGVTRTHWPQIDHPTPEQARYNTAVATFANKEADTDPMTEVDFTFTLRGANAHFLVADFTNFSMGYGAAHPSTIVRTYNWSFDLHRELAATDIFAANSNWPTKLQPATTRKLREDPDRKDGLWPNGDELTLGIRKGLTDPREWSPSSTGLDITFAQYQVAAYVYGMPTITFSWSELKPYLNPGFRPETLPRLKPANN